MSKNNWRFSGDTSLNSIPDNTSVSIDNGTLNVDCVMGKNVRITQTGKGGVQVNAATNWNADIRAEGDISVIAAVYKTRLESSGGNISVKYDANRESTLLAPNGNIRVEQGLGDGATLKGRKLDIGGSLGDDVTLVETGSSNPLSHTLTVNGVPGKNLKITQQGNGDIKFSAATNHFTEASSEGSITAVSAVYKNKLQAGKDITITYDAYNQASLSAPNGTVAIGGNVREDVKIRGAKVKVGGTIDASAKVNATGESRSFAERIRQSVGAGRSR